MNSNNKLGEAVAYLDVGAGHLDLGSDLSEETLSSLPKGRHMLGIIGTFGVEGFVRRTEDNVAEVTRKGNAVGSLVWSQNGYAADLPDGTKLYTRPAAQREATVKDCLTVGAQGEAVYQLRAFNGLWGDVTEGEFNASVDLPVYEPGFGKRVLYTRPAERVDDKLERDLAGAIDERDWREEVIDGILDIVLGPDRREWSSAYGYADAIEDVEDCMAERVGVPYGYSREWLEGLAQSLQSGAHFIQTNPNRDRGYTKDANLESAATFIRAVLAAERVGVPDDVAKDGE